MYAMHMLSSFSLSSNLWTWLRIFNMTPFAFFRTDAYYFSLTSYWFTVNSDNSVINSNRLSTLNHNCSVLSRIAIRKYYRLEVANTVALRFGLTIRKQKRPMKPEVNSMAKYLILFISNSMFKSFLILVPSKCSSKPKKRLNSLENARCSTT